MKKRVIVLTTVLVLAIGTGILVQRASADDVESRIAAFWQRVNAMQPTDYITAGDLGQWALNVIGRDARARLTVADFRAATAAMQSSIDRAGPGTSPASPVPTPPPSPSTTAPTAGFVIVSSTARTNAIGWYEIVGEVRNTQAVAATFVKVVGTFYDAAGVVIGTDFTYTMPSTIAPGDMAPFDLLTEVKGIVRYRLVVTSN